MSYTMIIICLQLQWICAIKMKIIWILHYHVHGSKSKMVDYIIHLLMKLNERLISINLYIYLSMLDCQTLLVSELSKHPFVLSSINSSIAGWHSVRPSNVPNLHFPDTNLFMTFSSWPLTYSYSKSVFSLVMLWDVFLSPSLLCRLFVFVYVLLDVCGVCRYFVCFR